MISLYQIKTALKELGVNSDRIDGACGELGNLLRELDDVPVKGRQNVDTLLGCMMAIEAIIGGEKNG